jgi:hypothetical protein
MAEATSIGSAALKLDDDFKNNTSTSKHAQLLFATAEYVNKQPWFRSLLKDKTALCCLK